MAVSALLKQKGGSISLFNSDNKSFLLKVLANLIVQLGITYYVMTNTSQLDPIYKWPLIIATFILLFFIAFKELPIYVKGILFCLFSFCFGKLFTIYKKKYGEEAINIAVMGALSVFGVMFAIGATLLTFGIKLSPLIGFILFIALLGLIIVRLMSIFGSSLSPAKKTIYGAGIVIFALYIVYDTNNILRRINYYNGDFITASMDYYLDIINLFSNILVRC